MLMSKAALLFLISLMCCVNAAAMEPLDDVELSDVSGAEGVQLTLRLRNNVDSTGSPIGCSGYLNPCRMGIEFAGREGVWLMLKDYYGVLGINDIRLEGDILPVSNTPYFNASRFLGADGGCLVASCNPIGMQAVRISYPFSKLVGQYEDFTLLMNIGRTSLEFDDGLTPGYMRDAASGSVLGFRMADSQGLNAPSRARFDGVAYVFGF
ncbi:MAG: DUF6160 family protein [Alcanivoracaceae bacterium]